MHWMKKQRFMVLEFTLHPRSVPLIGPVVGTIGLSSDGMQVLTMSCSKPA